MQKRIFWLIAVFGLLLTFAGGVSPAMATGNNTWQKIFIVDFIFDDHGVYEESSGIWYGTTPDLDIQSGPIEGLVVDSQNRPLMKFYLRDPRYQIGDALVQNPDGTTSVIGYTQYTPAVEIRIVFPYTPDAKTLTLMDTGTGSVLASVDLESAGTRIAEMYPEELEFYEHVTYVGSINMDYRPLLFLIGGISLILVSLIGYLFYSRKLRELQSEDDNK